MVDHQKEGSDGQRSACDARCEHRCGQPSKVHTVMDRLSALKSRQHVAEGDEVAVGTNGGWVAGGGGNDDGGDEGRRASLDWGELRPAC